MCDARSLQTVSMKNHQPLTTKHAEKKHALINGHFGVYEKSNMRDQCRLNHLSVGSGARIVFARHRIRCCFCCSKMFSFWLCYSWYSMHSAKQSHNLWYRSWAVSHLLYIVNICSAFNQISNIHLPMPNESFSCEYIYAAIWCWNIDNQHGIGICPFILPERKVFLGLFSGHIKDHTQHPNTNL